MTAVPFTPAELLQAEATKELERRRELENPSWFKESDGKGGLTGQRLAYWQSEARFPVVAAGRRSGKTLLSQAKLFQRLWDVKPWHDARYFFAGPTQGQAEQIAWQRMIDFVENDSRALRIRSINRSDLILTIETGVKKTAAFHIIGLDSPQRMEGRGWDGGIGDERADWKSGIWAANMRPALADRNGFCYLIGTPDFEGPSSQEFKDQFHLGLSKQQGYESFTWPSREVVSAEEIALARTELPPAIFRQEFEASFESAPGRAYPEFSRSVHVAEFEYNPNAALLFSCDFNRVHHNWGAYQFYDGCYWILDDIYLNNGTVEAMCRLALDYVAKLGAKRVVFYGDYSGEQKRAEATDSSWAQIKAKFPMAMMQYKVQPPVADRLEKVNSFFRNASGDIRTKVHARAKNHVNDFENVTRSMAYLGQGGANGELTHASSAFGYLVVQHQAALGKGNFTIGFGNK